MVDWFQKLNSQTDFSTINIEETAKSLGIAESSAIKIATKLLSTIDWTAVIAAGTWVFSKLADTVDHYINKAKYATEATETAQSKIDELNNSYKSHADLVNEVGDHYAELSQRINKNTNANIDLSADDYAEFLDINKRLAVCLISYDKESVNL